MIGSCLIERNSFVFEFFFVLHGVLFCFHLKPAPEQQRLDDAIGLLRDHAEINVSIVFFNNNCLSCCRGSTLFTL